MESLKSTISWAKSQGFLVGYTREDKAESVLFVDADQVLGLSQKLSMSFGDTLAGVILFKVARAVLLKSGAITPDTPKLEASMKAWEFVEAAYTGVYPEGWTKVKAAQLETCKKVSKTAPADKAGKVQIVRVRVNQNAPGYLDTTVKSSSGLGRLVSPTWDMVLGFKNHQSSGRFAGTPPITWEEYTLQYMEILERNVTEDVARKLAAHASNGQLSIACYCRLDTECCHNALLKSFLEEKYPQYFSTTGTTSSGGKLVLAFTGHRPSGLGGYSETAPMNLQVRKALSKFIDNAISAGFHTFISGMALGVDLWAAEAVIEHYPRVKLVAAVPFPGQYLTWPPASQERYMHVLEKATHIALINEGGRIVSAEEVRSLTTGGSKAEAVINLNKRNHWMVDHCDAVLGVLRSTASRGGTFKCLQYAREKGVPAIIYDPDTNTVRIENGKPPFHSRPEKRPIE